ncbi:MAG: GTP-binding protein [Prevotellaceae bacterium]|nr:GTP-binding protein [Prevotellaceae bacterium]MDY2749162.1 GTP-binding protein [Prevotella sp.]
MKTQEGKGFATCLRQEIPVLLLTGYLGSGKTTLLNRILNNEKGIKFAVIVNDIGEVNIDADLIQQGGIVGQKDDSLVALQNGCICCTLKMDLVEQISDITKMQRFDYIVIEASGICEPAPIAQTICSIPSMGEQYCQGAIPRLDCIVTIVDALRMKDEFACGKSLLGGKIEEEDIENLVIQQIEFCNIVLLNKASEVTPEELRYVREVVQSLQPKAAIIECDYGNVDFDRILGTGMFDFDAVATSAAWINEIEQHHGDEEHDEHVEHHHHHHHEEEHDEEHEEHCHHHHGGECTCGHHHHHHGEGEAEEYGIGTFVYYARKPFDITLFDDFIARRWPKNIIRAKGLCWFEDQPQLCYIFEQAGRQVKLQNAGQWYATMPEEELRQFRMENPGVNRDWDDVYGDRMQKLVFIGQKLDKEAITKELDACLTEMK